MSNVELAIRIRPFTDKELKSEKERVQVVSVINESTVAITNIKVSLSGAGDSRKRVRRYFADYTFDSACASSHPDYATQQKVFDKVGSEVLSTILSGNSACVLTYGQSATGKTHTMMGSSEQPGLVPRICKALASEHSLDVTVSYLEIYNEKVHDLLATEVLPLDSLPRRKGNARKDLRVREHPTKGTYVQNLRRVPVHDIEALLSVVSEGSRRRRTAATKRNTCSSRSHALLELTTASATLHLADLAGSEKSGWEGCGGRQKEGSNINKSLVALSNVISALAISPSAACYSESASTLRWTAQARLLPAPSNVTTATVTKAALQAQFDQLITQLANHFIQYKPELGLLQYDDKHWNLKINKTQNVEDFKANIGNIMNLGFSKTEVFSESTPSLSGGSNIINMEKDIEVRKEINKEIDELFGPTLERTKSGSDIQVVAPLRHKRRQFRSQEVLQDEKITQLNKEHRLSDAGISSTLDADDKNQVSDKTHVPILYDNQRAEIIASVTERLYSKLKKNEDVSKIEALPDKKQCEPKMQSLSELKICSNARQRLMELSKKALKNKRKIGIPAHTQTRKSVIRVKDQGVDVQTDLQPYIIADKTRSHKFQQDVGTETILMTPRLKEIAVGSKYGNLYVNDRSTVTEHEKVSLKSSSMMTDIVSTIDRCTQTHIQPPPRRKRRLSAYSKYIKKLETIKTADENYASPIININISPIFQEDSESQTSDDTPENSTKESHEKERRSAATTPDLLTNHNNFVTNDGNKQSNKDKIKTNCKCDCSNAASNISSESINFEDSSETDDLILPRVTVDPYRKIGKKDYEELILGYNEDVYPYNIKLSPTKRKDETKRVIRFKDIDVTPAECCSDEWQRKLNTATNELQECEIDNYLENEYFEPEDVGKIETGSFVWNKCSLDNTSITGRERNSVKSKSLKNKMYEEFDELTRGSCFCAGSSYDHDSNVSHKNDKKSSLKGSKTFDIFEKKIKSACNSLEHSVNKYDDYLTNFKERSKQKYKETVKRRTPTEYLQHLIRLRREAVSSDSF